MEVNERNVITLCGWMRTELELKGTDLLVYAAIYSYTQFGKEQSYNEGQKFLADWAGVDVRTVQRSISKLRVDGLIKVEETLFGNSIYKTVAKMSCRYDKMSHDTDDKMSGHIILNNNILNNTTTTNACAHVCEENSSTLDGIKLTIESYLMTNMQGTLLAASRAGLNVHDGMTWEELKPIIQNSIDFLADEYFIQGKDPVSVGRQSIRATIAQLMKKQNGNNTGNKGATNRPDYSLDPSKVVYME